MNLLHIELSKFLLLAHSTTSSTVHSDGGPLGANFNFVMLLGDAGSGIDCVGDIADDGSSDSWIGLSVDVSFSAFVGAGDQGEDSTEEGIEIAETGATGSVNANGLGAGGCTGTGTLKVPCLAVGNCDSLFAGEYGASGATLACRSCGIADVVSIYGPESQVHIAAARLQDHVPFEADMNIPMHHDLASILLSQDFVTFSERIKRAMKEEGLTGARFIDV